MENKLSFAVDKMELIEECNDSQFVKVKISAFASGNNAHDKPVSEETLKRSAFTIYDKPLVWELDRYSNDIGSHSPHEIPCGFVHRENNPVEFVKLEDGRLMLTVQAMIWKRYSGKILSFFERDGMEKPVSVELFVLEEKKNKEGKFEIVDLCYAAITILGSLVKPAIPSAKAEILAFSEAKSEYELQFSDSQDISREDDEMTEENKENFEEEETKENENKEEMAEDTKEEQDKKEDMSEEEKSDEHMMPEHHKEEMSEQEDFKAKCEEMSAKLEEMEKKFSALSQEHDSMLTKFTTIEKENTELKEFKARIDEEEKAKLEAEKNAKIEFALSEVSEYVPQEKIDEMREKVAEFATIDAWQNYVKAEAFEFAKNMKPEEKKIRGFALPYTPEKKDEKKSGSVWDKLK